METVNPTAETQASPDPEAAPTSDVVRPETPSHSEAEYEQLAKEKSDLQELLQRRQAEFENYRRRIEREKKEVFEYASMDVVKNLLPILDDFERALKVESADKEYARGMELIHKRLDGLLHKLGLEPISTAGAAFNAHLHDAVDMVETDEHADQTILDEYERGYNFKGRLLRPARVKVAVKR
jgi:molecular chaperone GrpE